MSEFRLSEGFLKKYKRKKPDFGFNGLGDLIYRRSYSRVKSNGKNEVWWETVQRVVEGIYNMQKEWIEVNRLEWNPQKGQFSAQQMYERMFDGRFLPGGRGLWGSGSPIITERKLYLALYNCLAISTETIDKTGSRPFCFTLDGLMAGAGVGFDTLGAGKIIIQLPNMEREITFTVPDSREGWVESLRLLLDGFFSGKPAIKFDYSEIRPAGTPLKAFGGVSGGVQYLIEMHQRITAILTSQLDKPISVRDIVDIMNSIAVCVVSGNLRRSALLALGPATEEFLNLKDLNINPERKDIAWASNNSIAAELGMDYTEAAERTLQNGEPGYIWLENARAFGRMGDPPDYRDFDVIATNPCGEIFLTDGEACNLCETFPDRHESLEDYVRTLKYAYLYAKTVTLGPTHWPETNRVMLRNRRLGISMTGIAQFITHHGLHELRHWMENGYQELKRLDEIYSNWLCVPRSRRLSTVKPSGSTSLLFGSTPGIHYPESRFYIRRVRLSAEGPLIEPLRQAGYILEPANEDPNNTVVVEFPVDVGEGIRLSKDRTMWEQLELAALAQGRWSDNAISVTVGVDKETEGPQIKKALEYYQYRLKSVSFLPRATKEVYEQMPYEEITEENYNELVAKLSPIKWGVIKNEDATLERYCTNDTCSV